MLENSTQTFEVMDAHLSQEVQFQPPLRKSQ